ncbi:MAG: non-homologous end-joining DNA ligase [Nocardiopsaceae bacterium]|nr:non-homologous end-joining DNA ligase [Nocardiopsaceae bacterium]
MDRLADYRGKRDPARTPEPVPPDVPEAPDGSPVSGIFVVQEHHARRLHWDFRLERDGVLVSWALPKGVPDDPAVNHLAVHTEDHPLEYARFQGDIPRGQYGAGRVIIWDHGTYEADKWTGREVKVTLHGQRLHGGYVLFATDGKNWMIHRERLPLPTSARPMLASPGRPPDRDLEVWGIEMKWDGVRALAFCENGRTTLLSRTGKDITVTYPELAGIASATGHRQALLDGEIVAFGPGGQPDFEALQPRMHVSSARQALRLAETAPVTFLAFDALQLDGRPLLALPYSARREILDSLTGQAGFLTPPFFPGPDLAAVLEVSVAQGLEGVVAKRLDSGYEPGVRTASWLKVKNQLRQEVVVAGWKPGKGNREGLIGSLLVGVYSDGRLLYCGHVGTGFTRQTLRMLTAKLRPLRRRDSPFDGPVPPEYARPAVWAEPRLVVEVSFERWTRAGRMRAPAYRGLRDDKEPHDVIRET